MSPAIAQSQTLDEKTAALAAGYYLDPTFWKNMDWGRPETSPLWQLPGWRQINGERHSGGVIALTERKISISGEEFEARWIAHNINGRRSLATGFADVKSRNRCSQIAGILRTQFGPPIINDGTINSSFSPETPLNIVTIDYQWDLGNTRISALCFGMDGKDALKGSELKMDFVWTANYSSIADQPKLIQKFALRCSQKISIMGREAEDLPELSFWVDIKNKNILNGHNIVLSSPKSFRSDDGVIEFSINSKNFNSSPPFTVTHYVLNRMNGSLDGMEEQDRLHGVRIAGRCEKIKAIQKKF